MLNNFLKWTNAYFTNAAFELKLTIYFVFYKQ